jgi:hypothetical protein
MPQESGSEYLASIELRAEAMKAYQRGDMHAYARLAAAANLADEQEWEQVHARKRDGR